MYQLSSQPTETRDLQEGDGGPRVEVQVAQEDKEPREGLGGRGAAQVLTEGRGLWEVSDHGWAKIHFPGGVS